ncbi:MAG: hypothetical protein JWN67_2533 [Actinomycetia bacterium]|nr:hypothetical protein [Actinomycetes bacterium]
MGTGPAAFADGDSIVELDRAINQLQALRNGAVGVWDAEKEWAPSRAKSGAAWLAWKCRRPLDETRRWTRVARQLRSMPETEAAWLAGEIHERHVSKLCSARRPETAEVFDRDEGMLLDNARRLSFAHFHRTVDYWLQHADPDGAEADADRQRDRREAHLDRSFEGMWFGKLTLDPISGTIVSNAPKAIEQKLFQADWAEAKARLGRDPLVTELCRTAQQRRADAFTEMATLARAVPADARRPEPLFTVVMGYEKFKQVCELANRTVVTPGSLVPYLTDALIERIVADGKGRVLDVGEARCFTGATRRAVEVLGEECFEDTCEVPAEDAQIDHIIEYSKDGPTRTWNGRPACGFHNRRRSRGP